MHEHDRSLCFCLLPLTCFSLFLMPTAHTTCPRTSQVPQREDLLLTPIDTQRKKRRSAGETRGKQTKKLTKRRGQCELVSLFMVSLVRVKSSRPCYSDTPQSRLTTCIQKDSIECACVSCSTRLYSWFSACAKVAHAQTHKEGEKEGTGSSRVWHLRIYTLRKEGAQLSNCRNKEEKCVRVSVESESVYE